MSHITARDEMLVKALSPLGSLGRCTLFELVWVATVALLGRHRYELVKERKFPASLTNGIMVFQLDQQYYRSKLLLLFQSGAVFWVCYGICLVIYRLTLHPLAKFPGPRLTAATKWWEFYLDVIKGEGGGFMYEVDRMHDVYGMERDDSDHFWIGEMKLMIVTGPIVRINPDEIHVRDATWLDTLYSGPGSVKHHPSADYIRSPVLTKSRFGTDTGPPLKSLVYHKAVNQFSSG